MVGTANIAAFAGRVVGNCTAIGCRLQSLLLESVAFLAVGLLAIFGSEHLAPSGISRPITVALLMSGTLVLWSNAIIVRLFADAQYLFKFIKDVCVAKNLNHC